MENTWENFWKSGSVDDYLAYCRQDRQAGAGQEDSKRPAKGQQTAVNPVIGRARTTFQTELR